MSEFGTASTDTQTGTRDLAARADGLREVRCPLKRGVIAAEACLEAQVAGCFCSAAHGALRGVQEILSIGPGGTQGGSAAAARAGKARHKAQLAQLDAMKERAARLDPDHHEVKVSAMTAALSPRQRQALRFIHSFSVSKGCSPTIKQIAAALGTGHPRVIQVLDELREWRGVRVLIPVEEMHPASAQAVHRAPITQPERGADQQASAKEPA